MKILTIGIAALAAGGFATSAANAQTTPAAIEADLRSACAAAFATYRATVPDIRGGGPVTEKRAVEFIDGAIKNIVPGTNIASLQQYITNNEKYAADNVNTRQRSTQVVVGEGKVGVCLRKRRIEQIQGTAKPVVQTVANPAPLAMPCTLPEDEALTHYNDTFAYFKQQNELKAGAGARDNYQYSYFLGSEGLKLIAPYEGCLGRHWAVNKTQLEQMRDAGLKGCDQLSSSVGSCTPTKPE